jgi:hypothetical protein
MTSLSGSSLSITGTSGTTTLNNGLIVSTGTAYLGDTSVGGSFSQTGSNTFSTGTGSVYLNGPVVFNGSINTGSNPITTTGTITCGSITCGSETDTGVLNVGGLLTANGGIQLPNQISWVTSVTMQ